MCTLLVVDDDPDVRELIKDTAKANKHEVYGAASEKEALQAARDNHVDAIVMDLNLGQQDGFEVLQHLRDAGEQSYAIIVSGGIEGRAQDFKRWEDLRIFDVLPKPFQLNELLDRVRAAAEMTRNEGRLCDFLDQIIDQNTLRLQTVPDRECG